VWNFSLYDPLHTARACPVWIASLSGFPLSSRLRWASAHHLSCGRLVMCLFQVRIGASMRITLPCHPDSLMCVRLYMHMTLRAIIGGMLVDWELCFENFSCRVPLVVRGIWMCHSLSQW